MGGIHFFVDNVCQKKWFIENTNNADSKQFRRIKNIVHLLHFFKRKGRLETTFFFLKRHQRHLWQKIKIKMKMKIKRSTWPQIRIKENSELIFQQFKWFEVPSSNVAHTHRVNTVSTIMLKKKHSGVISILNYWNMFSPKWYTVYFCLALKWKEKHTTNDVFTIPINRSSSH